MRKFLYRWLPITFGCHCRSDRSFFYHGKQFPLCARCTGELLGILISIPLSLFITLPIPVLLLLLLPLVIDGFTQMLTAYESTNIRRLLTGIAFGYSLWALFARSTVAAFRFGMSIA